MAQQDVKDLVVHLEKTMELLTMEQWIKLVGAMLVNGNLNIWGVRNILQTSWKDTGEIEVKWVREKTYIISVLDESVVEKILIQVPWVVMTQNFSVQIWPQDLALEEIQLELVHFWIQLRGIPLGLTSEVNVRCLVRDVGEFLELEDPSKA